MTPEKPPETFQETTLPSGLRVATERLPGVETVSISIAVAVGARYEEKAENGLSHLLEHMAFKGTSTMNARQIAESFDDMGASFNAYTSLEHTVYYARVLKEDGAKALALLTDILTDSVFDESELERERQVILQEIAMHNDQPEDLVFDAFHELAFPDHPLGRSILGPRELVANYSREEVAGYMRKHYTAPSMIVAAAGAVDHEQIAALATQRLGALPVCQGPAFNRTHVVGGARHVRKDLEQLHLMLGLPAFGFHDPDHAALQLYATMLGGGGSSNLFQEVREKRGLAYSVYAFNTTYADTGLLGVYAGVSEEQAPEVMPVVIEQILATAELATEAQLYRAKQQQKTALFMTRESTTAMAEWIGRHLLDYGRYHPAAELAAKVDAVTLDDIRRVSRRLLKSGPPVWTSLGPKAKLPEMERVQEWLAA